MKSSLTAKDKALAHQIQGDIPLVKRPYQMIAETIGLSEGQVIARIDGWRKQGVIRKFAAIVRHRQIGYERNAMVVWAVPGARCEATGKMFAAFKEITHCYERMPPFEGRYNLFTMIHFRNDQPDELIQQLAARSGITDFKILLSVEEFKKSSMTYF